MLIIVRTIPRARVLTFHTCYCVADSVISIRDYIRPNNGLPEPTGSLSLHVPLQAIALANKDVEKVLKEGSRVDKTSTSPSQEQQTHPQQLLRQMSYDNFFLFHSRSISIGSVFGLSFVHTLILFNVGGILEYNSFRKLFHGGYSLRTFLLTSRLL